MNTPIDRTTQKGIPLALIIEIISEKHNLLSWVSFHHVMFKCGGDEKMRQIKGKISLRIKKDKNCLTNVTNIK